MSTPQRLPADDAAVRQQTRRPSTTSVRIFLVCERNARGAACHCAAHLGLARDRVRLEPPVDERSVAARQTHEFAPGALDVQQVHQTNGAARDRDRGLGRAYPARRSRQQRTDRRTQVADGVALATAARVRRARGARQQRQLNVGVPVQTPIEAARGPAQESRDTFRALELPSALAGFADGRHHPHVVAAAAVGFSISLAIPHIVFGVIAVASHRAASLATAAAAAAALASGKFRV
jgi:hypothetical protein